MKAVSFDEQLARERSRALREPAWLLEDRLVAVKRYASLPLETSPLFTRHTEDPTKLLAAPPADVRPEVKGPKAKGLVLARLGEADPASLKAALTNDLPGFEHDRLTNLPRAFASGGAAVHVPRGLDAEEPLVVRYAPSEGAAFARNVVVLDEGARATVLVEVGGEAKGALGLTLEVLVGRGAQLKLLTVTQAGPQRATLLGTQARVGEGASLEIQHALTGGALAKWRTDTVLQGRGSRVKQGEVVFGQGEQRFDLTSNVLHTGAESVSDVLSKAALRDKARANIKGVITLTQEGKDSDSYLAQHAMLLSKQARCIAIPSLEIVNREIKRAKHAATVAQVDEAQVFYLMTRGLSEAEARKAIVMGFLGPLLDALGPDAGERVRASIEASWA